MKHLLLILTLLLTFALMGCGTTTTEPITTTIETIFATDQTIETDLDDVCTDGNIYGIGDYDFAIAKITWVKTVNGKTVYTVLSLGETYDIEVENKALFPIGELVLVSFCDYTEKYRFHEYVPFEEESTAELPRFRVKIVEVNTYDGGDVSYIVSKDGYTIGGIYMLETEDNFLMGETIYVVIVDEYTAVPFWEWLEDQN